MTDAGKAVFLSYASQDTEAAQTLCNTLRAAGIEVWFDQSELRGGDAWDTLIRRQIKGCYLFVPIISANTQSREEGYFRREWKIAVDRTNDMAEDRAFLLPIVIDGTSDSEARVPEKFREVQWTRLPAGANAGAFVVHVRRLLSPEKSVSISSTSHSRTPPVASSRLASAAAPTRATTPKSRSLILWFVAAFVVLAGGYVISERFLMHRPMVTANDTPSLPANEKSLAVLPFADMSEMKDQEYFSDGLAEELIDQLGKTPGLKVIARTSSFSFKGKSDDIPTIAAKLKVANVLEGSVRRSGDHLRVATQLIRADSGEQIWSETYDREFKDVFTVQDDIAAAVVAALKLKLVGESTAEAAHGTTNTEAYTAYLLGRQLYRQATPASYRRGIEFYQRAISLDPRYAQAYADLARSQFYLGDLEGSASLMHAARESAQKAIELDPRLGRGYAMRSFLRRADFDWVGAEADARQALALDPTDPSVLSNYADLYYRLGRFPEAVAMYRKTLERDPLADGSWAGLGLALAALHDYAAAYDAIDRALAANSNMYGKYTLAWLQLLDGKTSEALSMYQTIDFEPFRDTGVAMAEHTLGDAKASQAALDALIASSAESDAYQIAEVYAWRGEKDLAFEWLERAYRQQDGGLTEIKIDPYFASLHSDPRYAAFLKKLNFPP
ncbi:MAG: TIR domain-containing protein [Steroidobacteraceae bacterium]